MEEKVCRDSICTSGQTGLNISSAVDKTAVEQSASSSAGAGKQGASKAPLSQRKAVQRQNLEEARAYVMVYDQVQKKLVMNGTSDRFVHDIWGGAAGS
mmetsp:Transcript_119804/g.284653  ORF Transcript_119804/g.284653 Transcript_119804/m.284653 type:complete len:98 (-) Transcript_119804:204-497(-)